MAAAGAVSWPKLGSIAFSSEVDAGSREENASKQKDKAEAKVLFHQNQGSGLLLTGSPWLAHGIPDVRFPRLLWHLPRDYELAIRWLRPSFLTRDHWTPGRKGRDIHGLTPLRYVDEGKSSATIRAARSE
jgi:hypothetical protein